MGFQSDLKDGIKGGACALLSVPNFVADWAEYAKVEGRFGGGLPGVGVGKAVSNAADYFCDRVPEDRPPPPPGPRQPGQCPVLYNVTFDIVCHHFSSFNGVDSVEMEYIGYYVASFAGPLGSIVATVPSNKVGGYGNDNSPPPCRATHKGEIVGLFGTGVSWGGNKGNGNNQAVGPATITSIVRADEQPDDCGDPERRPELTIEQRTTEINVGGDNALLSIGKAVITGDGNVVAGLIVVGPTYEFSGQLNLTGGDVTINIGGKRPDTDDDDDEPEEDDENRGGIIGANVVAIFDGDAENNNNNNTPQGITWVPQPGDNPDIYVPGLGNVSFLVVVDGKEVWSKEYPVKNKQQFIEWDGALDAHWVAGTPRPGVSFTVTPVKRRAQNNDM